jgi:cytochrome P450
VSAYDDELMGDAFVRDPYPILARLRSEAPVVWSDAWDSWVVTRYDDCLAGLRDHAVFSNVGRRQVIFDRLPPETRAKVEPLSRHFSGGMGNVDPPEHARLRRHVSKSWTPRATERFREPVAARVAELLDRIPDEGCVDLRESFAFPLPALTISEILGLPTNDIERLGKWSDDFTDFMGTGTVDPRAIERSLEAYLAARDWLVAIIDEHRRTPAHDMIGALLQSDAHGGLDDDEIVAMCFLFMVGGHQTTTNLICNTVLLLLRNPSELAGLAEEPGAIAGVVEESLRLEAPFQQGWRVAVREVDLRGKRIRAGDLVRFMVGAANRDPERFPDPDAFDPTRPPNQHLSFGTGIHSCVGAALAKLEAETAIRALLTRYPTIGLDEAPSWRDDRIVRGLTSLRLQLATGIGVEA